MTGGGRRLQVDVFLAPGKLTVHTIPVNVKTIVGSCVAVCLYDPVGRLGGVNHYLLARPAPGDEPDNRFGSVATERLIHLVCRSGSRIESLRASVIGGGRPVDSLRSSLIGEQNAAVALAVLAQAGIRIVKRELGGDYGRKLLFNTGTGELIVRRVGRERLPAESVR